MILKAYGVTVQAWWTPMAALLQLYKTGLLINNKWRAKYMLQIKKIDNLMKSYFLSIAFGFDSISK